MSGLDTAKEAGDRASDAADVVELGLGEVPLLGSIWHGAHALYNYGAAGIDMGVHDRKAADGHMKNATMEMVKSVPVVGPMAEWLAGGEKGFERLFEPPESQAEKDEQARKEKEAKERVDQQMADEAAAKKRGPMGDVDGVYLAQKRQYEQQMAEAAAKYHKCQGPDMVNVRPPSLGDAITESRTEEGRQKALAYRIEAGAANIFAPAARMFHLGDISMETEAKYGESNPTSVSDWEWQQQHPEDQKTHAR
jgi:hypothetical protein